LSFSELDEIKGALKQSKEIGSIKQVLLRKELLLKVKQYDGKLANVIQRFQVRRRFVIPATLLTNRLQVTLDLDARFAQIAYQKGHMVRIIPISNHLNQLTTLTGHSRRSTWSPGFF
jgi:hypothetical protein